MSQARPKPIAHLILEMNVEAFTDVQDACDEICRLSKQLAVAIKVNWGAITVYAYPHDTPARVVMAILLAHHNGLTEVSTSMLPDPPEARGQ